MIRGLLESRGFTCYDEVYAVNSGGTSRIRRILSLSTIIATWLMCSIPLSGTRQMTKTKPRRFPSKSAIYMRSAPDTSRKNSKIGLEDSKIRGAGTVVRVTWPLYNFLLGLGADASHCIAG
ncbi:hypothetical protein O3M35_009404 [Rhynocoris fuscipes]|uniref:Uncharacterized protein n=1 Tax=Rhynocoris fuscipes TaxID=488301 RepID=A0AAW1DAD5_9HEMI